MMLAIIVDGGASVDQMDWLSFTTTLSTKIINKTVLEHQVDKIKQAGIENITVVTSTELADDLKDGKRWNINLIVKPTLKLDDLNHLEEKDTILLIPANCLMDLKFERFISDFEKSDTDFAIARGLGMAFLNCADYFNPVLIKRSRIEELSQFLLKNPALFSTQINISSRRADLFQYNYIVHALKDHRGYWELNRQLMSERVKKESWPGFPMNDNLWIDVDSRVNPQTEISGTVIIGKNSKINKGVKLSGFVVIGDNVVIDSRAEIKNSIIADNTYVGTDISIENSITKKSLLYHVDEEIGMKIDDNLIISESGLGNRLMNGFINYFKSF